MYEAKRAGGDRIVFFSGSRRSHEGRRLALARELRGADTRGELGVVFQPVFDLETGEIAAVEALLRWDSPTLGQVPPAEFIPVAEDTGSIVPIGAWVLRESCETVQRIARAAGREVELSVNVSARQLAQPGFARTVQLILSHAEFPAAQLTLEVAEAALIRADAVTARDAARARVARHPHRARRFRHRRVVAVMAEGAPGGRDQDRSQLHQRGRRRYP